MSRKDEDDPRVLRAFVAWEKRTGLPPTLPELADAVGFGSATRTRLSLQRLQARGWTESNPQLKERAPRAIRSTAKGREVAAQ